MADDPRDDDELLRAADADAFAVFYRRHVHALLGYFYRRTADAELAADLTAETFAAALDGAHRFRPERGPAVAWLYGIARRLLSHALRRGAVEDRARRRLGMAPLTLTDEALERVEAIAAADATARSLQVAFDALPADQREAIEAHVLDGRGVVPDGVDDVVLEAGGRTVSAAVAENAYVANVPGARAREPVTVRFEPQRRCGSRVARELLAAVPLLREPVPPDFAVPDGVRADLPERSLPDAARSVGYGEEVTYWVVPQVDSEDREPCAPATRACVIPASDGTTAGAALCATADEITGGGSFLAGPLGRNSLVYGLAPRGWSRVDVVRDGRTAGTVDVVGGVAGGRLRSCCDSGARIEFTQGPGAIVLLSATAAFDVQARFERLIRNPPRLEVFPIVVGDPVAPTERSEVRYLDGQRDVARELAAALQIERLVQVDGDNAGFAEPRAAVAVVAGDDFPEPEKGRMR